MNNSFLAVVKRIIAEQGEGILGDPRRIKPFIKDYAQQVPQEERRAFGRCLEQDFYRQIQAAHTAEERRRLKDALAGQLQAATGISAALCSGALDLLDAAVPLSPSPAASGPQTASPALPAMPRITKRTLIFGAAAGAGALAGALVAQPFLGQIPGTFWSNVVHIAWWAGFIGLGISIALIMAQTIYLKKKLVIGTIIKSALMGIAIGVASGALAQFIYGYTQRISPVVSVISRVLCWGLLGWGLGLGVSFYVPNYPKPRAMLAGFIGGIIGGVICVALNTGVLGEAALGLVIGLAISWVEEALREAWLTVFWGPKESRSISLGAKPVVFGSSREADVYVPSRHGDVPVPPVRAVFTIENGAVVMEDKQTGRRGVLPNGGEVMIDRLRVVVHTKS
ncbi:MAG: hypothetical protein LBD31_01795 [Treponema sp.]|jgi:hypothetical protein|nr:hypothetical protein [Treponema sp.]